MKRVSLVLVVCLLLLWLLTACGGRKKETVLPVETTVAAVVQTEAEEHTTAEAPDTEPLAAEASTTKVPTTEASTTKAPTTEASTTEAPTTEASTTEAPTTEAPTTAASAPEDSTTDLPSGLSAVADAYTQYLRTHWDEVDMAHNSEAYSEHVKYFRMDSSYPNVAFFDVTGDDVPEMLLLCHSYSRSWPHLSLRAITAKAGRAYELHKPNGTELMSDFWDNSTTGTNIDTVLFSYNSSLYFSRTKSGDGPMGSICEIGRLSYNEIEDYLYWEIILEHVSQYVMGNRDNSYLFKEEEVDEDTYQSVRNSIINAAEEFILYGTEGVSEPPEYKDFSAEKSDYIAMTPTEALEYLASGGEVLAAPVITDTAGAAVQYSAWLREHWGEVDVAQYFAPNYLEDGTYPNVAFYDVTGDAVPEMLAVCYDKDKNGFPILCLRIVPSGSHSARELHKPNGDKIMNLFWDNTVVAACADTVLFSRGSDIYFYRSQAADGKGGHWEEIGQLVHDKKAGNLLWEIILEYENVYVTEGGNRITYKVEEKTADESTYNRLKNELLDSADIWLLRGMDGGAYWPPLYLKINTDKSDYIGMTPLKALEYLSGLR